MPETADSTAIEYQHGGSDHVILSTQLASRTQIQALPETKKAAATDAAAVAPTDEAKPAVSVTISGAAMKAAAAENLKQ